MRINLNQIFGNSSSNDQVLPDASDYSYQPSEEDSSTTFDYKYKLNNGIFDTSATHSQHTPVLPTPSLTSSEGFEHHHEGRLPGERLYY